ncbi:SGNH hydrolase-type esterase domain-containing protein [Coniella lustricola]|uniref:SGNH hydrolase-type esterase domain-containing protein n=1 Tax=Coniella lustricola TaxID=2025994 RepID=A0A2T2ZW30_9PEZI|nr:SGNH hydrolase-type esterase domain-containing protein [Coniella lustricola]
MLAAALTFLVWPVESAQRKPSHANQWVDIWGTMPQLVEYTNMPPAPFNESGIVFQNASVRQTVFITQSAPTIRLIISNVFGGSDLPISSATLATPLNGSAGTSAIKTGSLAPVTWSGGLTNITIPMGARAISDPIKYPVEAQQVLTISLYLATGQTTNLITGHPGSRVNSYYSPGDVTALADVATLADTQTSQHWYFISAIEGYMPTSLGTRAIFIIGDSITDGRESDNNMNDRWPDNLLRRLQAVNATTLQKNIAVINQAAGANRVLYDGNGPNAFGRVDRDILAQSGVTYAMVFEGVNDIGTAATDVQSQKNVGDRLISAFDQMIAMVHAKNIPIFGATITPFGGSGQAYSDPNREATRQRVNRWIRESRRYDAVVDFDAVIRDPANASIINPVYDSGDHLHPNEQGYLLMANSFDLSLFDKFKDGVDVEI